MCTAITYCTKDFYFGRNLDLEYSYGESVTITPRNYEFRLRNGKILSEHYALIGIAAVSEDYPLYYEAVNEKGPCIAGLNFPGNATYYSRSASKENIAPFELIPWILGQCTTISEALKQIETMNLWHHAFSERFPLSPLHWLLADRTRCVVIEPMSTGLRIYENPTGVLTNNPPFLFQLQYLNNYLNLSAEEPVSRFADRLNLTPYSRGMGAIGLPGDLSSSSRFVRGAFTKWNSKCGNTEEESVCQFFHILGSVEQQYGCVKVNNAYEKTVYSSCINMDKGIYYYTTYENRQITGIRLMNNLLDKDKLITYPLKFKTTIAWEN